MTWVGLGRLLSAPFRAARGLFPFTQEGRQTLVYLIFAGAGPSLTLFVLWIMDTSKRYGWKDVFENMAWVVGGSLLIIVCGLGMFVSIRAVKLGKDGFSAEGGNAPAPSASATVVATVKAGENA